MVQCSANSVLECTLKEVVTVRHEIMSCHLLQGAEENTGKFGEDCGVVAEIWFGTSPIHLRNIYDRRLSPLFQKRSDLGRSQCNWRRRPQHLELL
jgi:hypothetical protein